MPQYQEPECVRLDDDQLLCLMSAILLSGTFTFKDPVKMHYCAMRIAEQIYDRLVRNQEYTEWDRDEDLALRFGE